ncbi:MAG TPA: hypothetical protein VGK74_27285 [Symbiobacteriaceae bacterium]|jgi:hypothetical protein
MKKLKGEPDEFGQDGSYDRSDYPLRQHGDSPHFEAESPLAHPDYTKRTSVCDKEPLDKFRAVPL